MSLIIVPKKSSVSGKVPNTFQLQLGEIALNLADKTFYAKVKNDGIDTDVVKLASNAATATEFYSTRASDKVIQLNDSFEPQAIDILATAEFQTAEYTIQATHSEFGKQISKLNIIYDEDTADSVEYGIVYTKAKLCDYTVFYIGSMIQVLADPHVPDLQIKFIRTTIV